MEERSAQTAALQQSETRNPNQIAPRPLSLAETGLSDHFTYELIAKHLYSAGVLTLHQLSERIALAGTVLEEVIAFLRKDAHIEVRGAAEGQSGLRYALTDRGRALALDSLIKSGYIGPAPVPLNEYDRVVRAQSVHDQVVSQSRMQVKFANVVLQHGLLDQLGPAMHSGRAIFIYGPPGVGKTYICSKLASLFDDDVLIPHAISLGDTVIQVFDPVYHHRVEETGNTNKMMLEHGHDPRYVRCRRPGVMTGGELTLDMLELSYDADSKQYQAPLQLKANNGVFMIDDLGRQRVAPVDLLNRWIVPMEKRVDFLTLHTGRKVEVPFDVLIVFSTNLPPRDLVDEAFLRRIRHKIQIKDPTFEEFREIFKRICQAKNVPYDDAGLRYLLEEYYVRTDNPPRACHPRDIVDQLVDIAHYLGVEPTLSKELLDRAAQAYFVEM